MGTYNVTIQDLLTTRQCVTIYCLCLQTALWTEKCIARFSPNRSLWSATETFGCRKCGRSGKVRDIELCAPRADLTGVVAPCRARSEVAQKVVRQSQQGSARGVFKSPQIKAARTTVTVNDDCAHRTNKPSVQRLNKAQPLTSRSRISSNSLTVARGAAELHANV